MKNSVNISTDSWHYDVAGFYFNEWEINTICEYWFKVYFTIISIFAIISYFLYGYYVMYLASTVEKYKLSGFELFASIVSIIVSIIITSFFLALFVNYIVSNWSFDRIFKNCKQVNFTYKE